MEPDIKPTKVVKPERAVSGGGAIRAGYDARITPPESLPDDYKHFRLFNFFNLDDESRANKETDKKIKEIHDWARAEAQDDDINKIYHVVLDLQGMLGIPTLGSSRIDQLYHYVRISNSIDDLVRERNSLFSRGGY